MRSAIRFRSHCKRSIPPDPTGVSCTNWSGLPPGLSYDATHQAITGSISTTASTTAPYSVSFTVTDGQSSIAESFSWSITAPSITVTVPADQTTEGGTSVSVYADAWVDNGDPVSFSATGLGALGLNIDVSTGLISGSVDPWAASGTPHAVTITATDEDDSSISATQTFSWTVDPALTLSDPGPQETSPNSWVDLNTLVAQSPLSGTFSYAAGNLPGGLSIASDSGCILGDATTSGRYLVTVTATLQTAMGNITATQAFTWTVTPLRLDNPGPQFDDAGDEVDLSLDSSDTDAGDINYTVTGLPSGLDYDRATGRSGAKLTRRPTRAVRIASRSRPRIRGAAQSLTESFEWYVAPAPKIAVFDAGAQSNWTGDDVYVPIAADDPFGGEVSFSAREYLLPLGLDIDPTDGVIEGTIASGAASSTPYSVTITATDGSHSATDTFSWTVTVPTLTFSGPGDQVSPAGLTVSVPLEAHAPGGASVTFYLVDTTLPTGLTFTGTAIAGTPLDAGNYLITVKACASGMPPVTRSFNWQVTAAGVAFPGNQTSTEGQTITPLQLQGVGGDEYDPLTYAASGLPAGLSIEPTTGLISGTINAKTAGTYLVDVSAMNEIGGGSQSFYWTVNPKVSVTTVSDQTSKEGDTVAVPVVASESGTGTLTYSARGLPTGVSIDSGTGLISGTLASGTAMVGGFTVTVTVADNSGSEKYSTRISFYWTVKPTTTPGRSRT